MCACVVVLLVEVAVLPGAASPFRLVKESVALGGLLLVAAFSLAAALRRGTLTVPRGPVAAALVVLPVLQAMSATWSRHPHRAVETAAATAVWVLVSVWLATLEDRERNRVAVWAATGAAVSSAVLILQAAGLHLLAMGGPADGDRGLLFGLTGNPADLSMAAALLLPALLWMPVEHVGSRRRWTLVAILATGIAVSQTLTGYVALGLLALVVVVRRRSRRVWLAAAAGTVVLVGLAFATGIATRVDKQVSRIQKGDWYFLLSARADGWTAASQMVRTSPLTGVGAGGFTVEYYPSRLSWLDEQGAVGGRGELATHFAYAHNDPFQLASELGLAGLLWLAAILVALVRSGAGRDPTAAGTALALAPFALLHYPLHLAVGVLPVVLVLGRSLAGEASGTRPVPRGSAATAAAVLLVAAALGGAAWQLQRLALDVWRGSMELGAARLERFAPEHRPAVAGALEAELRHRIRRAPGDAAWLWRILGQVRFAAGDPVGAEIAFRTSNSMWPHEDAEFWLGQALAAQGRRAEALVYLGRVCRTNPALIRMIPDPDLQRAVRDLLRARQERAP